MLAHLGGYVGPCWGYVAHVSPASATLGLSLGSVGPSRGYVWPIGALCCPTLTFCWPSLDICRPILPLCWPKQKGNAKNWAIWKPNPQGPHKPHAMEGKHARLAHFGCHVGPQSGLCWQLLGLGWPILEAMLAHLGAMLTHRGVILTQLGGYVGPS